jgi:hypothetical protein
MLLLFFKQNKQSTLSNLGDPRSNLIGDLAPLASLLKQPQRVPAGLLKLLILVAFTRGDKAAI